MLRGFPICTPAVVWRTVAIVNVCLMAFLSVPLGIGDAAAAAAEPVAPLDQLVRDFTTALRTTRGRGVTVAVLSSGVDAKVAALSGSLEKEKDLVGLPRPRKGKGTALAALITGNGRHVGAQGLAPATDILPVRVYPDRDDPGYDRFIKQGKAASNVADGIRYATDHGADVILVCPYFYGGAKPQINDAVAYAQSKDAVVIAGNDPADDPQDPSYPAALPGVIGVGATDAQGHRLKKWSDANSSVLVSAPGIPTPTVGPGGEPWQLWGTASATAVVVAAVAFVRSEYPELPQHLVVQAIAKSARHPKGGYNTEVGFGMVNPAGALREAAKLRQAPPAMTARTGIVADTAHFGGPVPGEVRAVRPDRGRLSAFGGLAAAGLLAIVLAAVLAVRSGRRSSGVPSTPAKR